MTLRGGYLGCRDCYNVAITVQGPAGHSGGTGHPRHPCPYSLIQLLILLFSWSLKSYNYAILITLIMRELGLMIRER